MKATEDRGRQPAGQMASRALAERLPTGEDGELIYLPDVVPGIRRLRARHGFRYVDEHGKEVRDSATLARVKSLAIPPAWEDVWISPDRRGHVQATGRDAKKRKQYRYHPQWRRLRDENKYHRLLAFGKALPRLRERVERDLARPGLPAEKVLAAIVKLLDTTFIRVGNDEYARDNGSFGLTTLRDRHVDIDGPTVRFEFRGKSGKLNSVTLRDRRLANVIRRCRDIPGYELFQYIDEDGARRRVTSEEVNAYIREAAGADFSTKDFRTWNGTVLAARALQLAGPFASGAEARRIVVQAVESVAKDLGNTAAVCRRCYIHPEVIEAYVDGSLVKQRRPASGSSEYRSPEEDALLRLLARRARAAAN